MSDRTAHAYCEGFAVVRYNRGGKWYVESVARGRSRVGLADAVQRAFAAETLGGEIHPLKERVRQGSILLYLGLLAVAEAIEKRHDQDT